jgi:hypothetical protein
MSFQSVLTCLIAIQVRFVLDGGLFNPYNPDLRLRRANPIILPSFPLLPPGTSAYLTDWSDYFAESTGSAIQPPPLLQARRLNASFTALSWDVLRLYAPGPLTFYLVARSDEGVEVQVINVTESDVRQLVFNDTAAAILGGKTLALRVLNDVGLSPLSNDVAIQPVPATAAAKATNNQTLMLGLAIGLPLLLIVLLLLALVYYLRRWRRDTVVNFPKPDEFELERDQVCHRGFGWLVSRSPSVS